MRIYGEEAVNRAIKTFEEHGFVEILGEEFFIQSIQNTSGTLIVAADIELIQVRRKNEKHL